MAGDLSLATATSLVFTSLGAFAIPLLCRPLRVPPAVGEILYGILVGPYLLHLVSVSRLISQLAELGMLLLMFTAGLEIDFRSLEEAGKGPVVQAAVRSVVVIVTAQVLAWVMGWPPFLGLVLGVISIGVLLGVLQELKMMKSSLGQELLLMGSLGEFFSIVIATGVNAHEEANGLNWAFLLQFSQLGLVFALAWVVLVVLRLSVWWKAEAFSRLVETHDSSEVGVRAGMALMFIFVAVASALHIEPILGAFMAGALFAFVFRDRGALELKFLSLGNGFFVPVFFIAVGLRFELPALWTSDFLLFFQMLGAVLITRLVPVFLFGGSGPQGWAGALLLSCPLTLMVVFADLGVRLELIASDFRSTLVLLAVSTSVLFPFIARALLSKSMTSTGTPFTN
ncbi:MAG: cation:proton antiporter [Candidatus Eremiobacteraeota bacterium]|nr:cation:proton antiporter [Candidatus Eremiobacteraeota bacterium]MCW5870589.1 cation:proton antiporter [Candidatus Eremiobacteraeota bacterium]